LGGRKISLFSAALFESEIKKNQRPKVTPATRTIIVARINLLPKNLDGALELSTSSGKFILNTTGKNNY